MEIKNLNLIPEGDKPIIHASQFDENRSVRFDLKDGTEEYTLLADLVVTCNIKKVDGNIVTFEVENTESTYVVITLPLQATACAGPNIGEIVITDEETSIIGTINFILEVERSPMLGGIESASDIHDLTEQIEVIVTQVIATDYYTKSEVDNLLDDKADITDLPDMSNYYDKSSVDTLLNGKANVSDLNNYYNKTQVDNLLDNKADISDLPDMSDYYDKSDVNALLAEKADISDLPDMSNYYTKTQIDNKFLDIMPVNSSSGAIANFTTLIVAPLEGLKTYITAQGGGGTPQDEKPIIGFIQVNLTRAGKNLFNKANGVLGYINGSGVIVSANSNFSIEVYQKINAGQKVTLSANTSCQSLTIAFYDKDKSFLSRPSSSSVATLTGTASVNGYVRFGLNYDNANHTLEDWQTILDNIQIMFEVGSARTTYDPYNADTFTLSLGQTIYGGYVDWENGKLVITNQILTIDGTETDASFSITLGTGHTRIEYRPFRDNGKANESFISDKFESVSSAALYGIWNSTSPRMFLGLPDTVTTVAEAKTWFSNNNTTVVYPLATPIEIDLPTTMPSTIEGEQNWFVDSGDIELSFKQDIQNYVDSKISAANANRTLSMISPVRTEESKGDEDER